MERCKGAGVKADGMVTKCDNIIIALKFYNQEKVLPRDHQKRSEVEGIIEWTLGGNATENRKKEIASKCLADYLETEEDDDSRTVEEIESVLHCEDLWSDFDDLCSAALTDNTIEASDLTLMTGAVMGVSVDEYRKVKMREGVFVMCVHSHKTSNIAPAKAHTTRGAEREVGQVRQCTKTSLRPLR